MDRLALSPSPLFGLGQRSIDSRRGAVLFCATAKTVNEICRPESYLLEKCSRSRAPLPPDLRAGQRDCLCLCGIGNHIGMVSSPFFQVSQVSARGLYVAGRDARRVGSARIWHVGENKVSDARRSWSKRRSRVLNRDGEVVTDQYMHVLGRAWDRPASPFTVTLQMMLCPLWKAHKGDGVRSSSCIQ